jgi:hypothetical protein
MGRPVLGYWNICGLSARSPGRSAKYRADRDNGSVSLSERPDFDPTATSASKIQPNTGPRFLHSLGPIKTYNATKPGGMFTPRWVGIALRAETFPT